MTLGCDSSKERQSRVISFLLGKLQKNRLRPLAVLLTALSLIKALKYTKYSFGFDREIAVKILRQKLLPISLELPLFFLRTCVIMILSFPGGKTMTILIFLAALLLCVLLTAYLCYRMAFYAPDRKPLPPDTYSTPEGKAYAPYREQMVAWIKALRAMPSEAVSIQSFDGLALRGRYYEYTPGAPIELMIHGYRSTPERDLCGGVQRCFQLKRNVLLIHQRGCGESDGNVITFGILEHRDCLQWVGYLVDRFGPDVQIILTGISMGAATVMMAGGTDLPPQVKGIIADCGYTSPKEIIQKVVRDMKLPPKLAYPFIKLGARLFGRFDLEAFSPLEAMKNCRVPVFFIHGEADGFVPCEMSIANANACAAPHKLFTVPGAGHGLAYMLDREGYHRAIAEMHFPQGE